MNARSQWVLLTLVLVAGSVKAQSLFDLEQPERAAKKVKYPLRKENGPYLIRVMSFVGNGASGKANALAAELREQHQIDAYVFQWQPERTRLKDKLTREQRIEAERVYEISLPADADATMATVIEECEKKYSKKPRLGVVKTKPPENWVVFAGDFAAMDSWGAKRLLEKIRKIEPKSIPTRQFNMQPVANELSEFGNGSAKAKGAFASAMIVVNPLHEAAAAGGGLDRRVAKMLLTLNEGPTSVYNLLDQGYVATIMVAQFKGEATLERAGLEGKKPASKKSALEVAAQNAIILTEQLRRMGYDAYVFHGAYASIVCIGGYNGPNDPRIKADLPRFANLMRTGELKQAEFDPPQVIPTPRRPVLNAN